MTGLDWIGEPEPPEERRRPLRRLLGTLGLGSLLAIVGAALVAGALGLLLYLFVRLMSQFS